MPQLFFYNFEKNTIYFIEIDIEINKFDKIEYDMKTLTIILFVFLTTMLQAQIPAQVLLLKVDYTTNRFEGGQIIELPQSLETFTIKTEYKDPGDFGWIKLFFSEMGKLLFYGTIHWMGTGNILFPEQWLAAGDFHISLTADYVEPANGFENVFDLWSEEHNYLSVWGAVQSVVEVREFLRSDPQQTVKIFLYTPTIGVVDPEKAKWILLLHNSGQADLGITHLNEKK
jgi:hypothetical protein